MQTCLWGHSCNGRSCCALQPAKACCKEECCQSVRKKDTRDSIMPSLNENALNLVSWCQLQICPAGGKRLRPGADDAGEEASQTISVGFGMWQLRHIGVPLYIKEGFGMLSWLTSRAWCKAILPSDIACMLALNSFGNALGL